MLDLAHNDTHTDFILNMFFIYFPIFYLVCDDLVNKWEISTEYCLHPIVSICLFWFYYIPALVKRRSVSEWHCVSVDE